MRSSKQRRADDHNTRLAGAGHFSDQHSKASVTERNEENASKRINLEGKHPATSLTIKNTGGAADHIDFDNSNNLSQCKDID